LAVYMPVFGPLGRLLNGLGQPVGGELTEIWPLTDPQIR
jgi:hypothetical protein